MEFYTLANFGTRLEPSITNEAPFTVEATGEGVRGQGTKAQVALDQILKRKPPGMKFVSGPGFPLPRKPLLQKAAAFEYHGE